jgi:Cu+-exporting ATPase
MLKQAPSRQETPRQTASPRRNEAATGPGATGSLAIAVGGMGCASCVGRVEKAVRSVPGVADASVNLATGQAHVTVSDRGGDLSAVVEAIRRVGYEPAAETVELAVRDMSCASCVGRVERALASVPGVIGANVNLATGKATVRIVRDAVTTGALIAAVGRASYAVEAVGDAPDLLPPSPSRWSTRWPC